jgi:ribosome-associated protein
VTSREKAELAKRACEAHKAIDVVVLDLGESVLADYFVVAAGRSRLQVHAIADGVAEAMAQAGVRLGHREGYEAARWVLLDYGDVVVHVFSEEERRFYALERLWGEDAPVPSQTPAPTAH